MSSELHSQNPPAGLDPENRPDGTPPVAPLAVRPRFQFGMRALLLAMLVGGAVLGFVGLVFKRGLERGREAQSLNNLKQIGIALHNYHDIFKGLPPQASTDPLGQPQLSWRVHILPLVEHEPLYRKFRLNEPWDSPHNARLIPLMPKIYESPISRPGMKPLPPGKTCYLAPRGPDTIFPAPIGPPPPYLVMVPVGLDFSTVTDGLSNTIMVLEAAPQEAVIWTRPDDWDFDPSRPRSGLLGHREGGFQAVMGDGFVQLVPETVSDETLRRLFIRNDRLPVDPRKLESK
jgi:hypothetical protein